MLRPLAAVIASVLITGCVTPPAADATLNAPASTISANAAVAPHAAYEQDRQAILAMAGDYKVTFDFIETVAFADGYKLKDRKVSGADEIVRVAEDERSDLIVLGTHGRTSVKDFFVGSTAERVVKNANCAVLAIKPEGYPFLRD